MTSQILNLKFTAGLLFQDLANGKHLGTWQPGFPELQVQKDSPVNGSKVQCCLLFMAHGLEKVLDDQKRNLNPGDETLHENLRQAIFMNNMLLNCMKELIGGECSPAPSPPKMPKHVFERKQWSHTLLKTGRDYLGWLELKVGLRFIRVRGKSKLNEKYLKAKNKTYMKGSRYLP